ncbi:MAG TPA: DUF484 family protein [Magnetospirillum sp.]|nr:DUF484 family protein [Magnetospirillum sp.]
MAHKRDDAAHADSTGPTEAQVAAYLRRHGDFLLRHPDLVLSLSPPSRWAEAGAVVDMQAFMIDRLKEEVNRIKGAAEDLILTSRSNMSTQNRTHQAVLVLLEAADLPALAQVVADDLPPILDVDVACLCFEDSDQSLPELESAGIRRIPAGSVNLLMGGPDRNCALNEELPGDPALFGAGAGLVASSALVRLTPGGAIPDGVLTLGSRHGCTFHAGQGTELISFLARVIEVRIQQIL